MLVAFCDQLFGNSTPPCSKAGFSGSPITASRISQSSSSNGWIPGVEKRRSMTRPLSLVLADFDAALAIIQLLSFALSGWTVELPLFPDGTGPLESR